VEDWLMGRSRIKTILIVSLLAFTHPGLLSRPAAKPEARTSPAEDGRQLPRLEVSENRRFLVTEHGRPFFWLGDTAWRLRMILPADVDRYLSNRVRHSFNVIQVQCGYDVTDYAGNRPFLKDNPGRPNEAFWRTMDAIVTRARDHGLYIVLAPMWGEEYGKAFGTGTDQAHRFGRWLGRRYATHTHVLWMVSGEYDAINSFRLPISDPHKNIFNSMAQGLREAHGGAQLMCIHPGVILTSSKDFHRASWLDFNMLQSGHFIDSHAYHTPETHDLIAHDYALSPAKPVLDGEPIYEDTPDAVWKVKHVDGPRAGADAVCRKAYWAVFSGAFGHTYGHNDIYSFFEPEHPGQILTLTAKPRGPGQRGSWRAALEAPGGSQMKHLRALMESRPFLSRIPDSSLVREGASGGPKHIVATRDSAGSYAMVYAPAGGSFRVRIDRVTGPAAQAWWFDPRHGRASFAGTFDNHGEREFTPPSSDGWVLVLDDASRGFRPPGSGGGPGDPPY
jgi:hypothetical protein